MIGRCGKRSRGGRRIVLGLAVIFVTAACASPWRNPFAQGSGPIRLTIVNSAGRPVSLTLFGLGDPTSLGLFLDGETRFLEFNLEGRADISVRVTLLNSGQSYDTFRTRADPGDKFLLEIEKDIRISRLIRTRTP